MVACRQSLLPHQLGFGHPQPLVPTQWDRLQSHPSPRLWCRVEVGPGILIPCSFLFRATPAPITQGSPHLSAQPYVEWGPGGQLDWVSRTKPNMCLLSFSEFLFSLSHCSPHMLWV